ncbi:putative imidazolonepropionase, partial [Halocaridina rubra]
MQLLIRGASQVVQVANRGEMVKLKSSMGDLAILTASESEGLSIAVDSNGLIASVGTDSDICNQFPNVKWDSIVEANGRSVIPGLVDGHTHPVWDGDRVHEFAMK